MELEELLGNRLRLKILKVLSQIRELNISEIARKIDANHATAMKHLRVLEEEGILQHKKFGRIHLYRFNEGSPKARAVKAFIEAWESTEKH